jgi:hypothetical protein
MSIRAASKSRDLSQQLATLQTDDAGYKPALWRADAGVGDGEGMCGVRSTRLRGQGPCAVPEGHRTHQPPPATNAS